VEKSLFSLSAQRKIICASVICILASLIPVQSSAGSIPFTKNMGQWPDSILFRASANGATMWFTKNGIWYQFFKAVEKATPSATAIDPSASWAADISSAPYPVGSKFSHENDSILTTMIKAEFVGASSSVEVLALEEMEYKCNYFIGNDNSQWRSNVPNYTTVTMRGLYPDVEVKFSSKNGLLHEEMIATSSSALAQVKVEYRGAESVTPLSISSSTIKTSLGEHTFEGIMLADQSAAKFSSIPSKSASAGGVELAYSTYFGGDDADWGQAVAVDGEGCAYITGGTRSSNFPTDTGYHAINHPRFDGFLAKLSPYGSAVLFCTYIGGWSGGDLGYQVKVDSSNAVVVSGYTYSTDFPTLHAVQNVYGGFGREDVFVVRFSPNGDSLIYSTYLGGEEFDFPYSLSLDTYGSAVIVGTTNSVNFPIFRSLQSQNSGQIDHFLTKIAPTGDSLIFSTYLGGSSYEWEPYIAIDGNDDIILISGTSSQNYILQSFFPDSGATESFLMKVSKNGDSLLLGRYFQDIGIGSGSQFALDNMDNVYMASINGSMIKYSISNDSIVYNCFISGGMTEWITDVAVDNAGAAYVAGHTSSPSFTTMHAYQDTYRGGDSYNDCWVAKVAPNGTLDYSTFLAGTYREWCNGLVADSGGNAYVIGLTASPDFPVHNPFQGAVTFASSVFVTKLAAYSGPNCCLGTRGNVDGDFQKLLNVQDVSFLARRLFRGGPPAPCFAEADVVVSGSLNIVDLIFLIRHVFSGGPPPPTCP
jgi:Beta-propeller repeat